MRHIHFAIAVLLAGCGDVDHPPGPPNPGQCTEGEVRTCYTSGTGTVDVTAGTQSCNDRTWSACTVPDAGEESGG